MDASAVIVAVTNGRPGARRHGMRRQNFYAATLLVPLGATVVLAVGKVALRHAANAPAAQLAELPTVPPSNGHWQLTPPRQMPAPIISQLGLSPVGSTDPLHDLAIREAMLRRDPANSQIRRATVLAALQAGQLGRAEWVAEEGRRLSPSEPMTWVGSAEVAKARGDRVAALQQLARARTLRMQQLGYSDNGDDDSTLPAVTLSPGGEPYRTRLDPTARWTPPAGVAVRQVQYAPEDRDLTVPPGYGRPATSSPPLAPALGTGTVPSSPDAGLSRATSGSGAGSAFNDAGNPFRPGGVSTGDSLGSASAGAGVGTGGPPLVTDPTTLMIDRDIAALGEGGAPTIQAGFGFRVRSGDEGLSRLNEYTTPIEGEFSPGGYGRVKMSLTPTFLQAGRVDNNTGALQSFGTGAFALGRPANQHAEGVAPSIAYAYGDLAGDIGLTPIGFPVTNVVGGLQWTPRLTDSLSLRVIGENRAITDSLLSYAGTRDVATGQTFGGVQRARGRVNLEATVGLGNVYAGVGGGVLTGNHVARNTEVEAGAGGSYPVYSDERREVRLGLDLVYLSFDKNLGSFTLGQGGYFSPQQYFAAIVPINFRDKVSEDLTYEIGGGVGVQSYRQKSSPYFPDDPLLQAALVAQQANPATAVAGVGTVHGSSKQTGLAGAFHASIDYRVAPNVHIGGRVAMDHAGDYTEGSGLVYARYIFNGAGQGQ